MKAEREKRLEIEKSRAWLWFNAAPAVGNCITVPDLEKAKFEAQCAPRQSADGALGLFDVKLSQLQSQRESLAARIAVIRNDFERMRDRAARQSTVVPPEVQALGDILAKLDQVDRRAALLRRFAVEVRRPEAVDLGSLSQVMIEQAPAGLPLRLEADEGAPLVGQTSTGGDVVIVLGEAPGNSDGIALVHADLGMVFANKTAFYSR